jgi:predicted enzyme related to lactoylglutathione lyase
MKGSGVHILFRGLKYLWALPNTLLGLSILPLTLLSGGGVRIEQGAIEVFGGFTRFFLRRCLFIKASAMCLGHVILGVDRECLDLTRLHEHVHVRQYERWGPFMLPLYFLFSFLAWRRGENFYYGNRFEREAYEHEWTVKEEIVDTSTLKVYHPLISTSEAPAMILGLRTCIFHVRPEQLESAKAWYTSVAGRGPYFDQPFYVGFNVGGFELGLDPNGGNPGPGGTVIYWGTANILAEVERLAALGATIVNPVQEVGGGIKVAVVADPFGNRFGVIENPHFDPKAVR